MTTAATGRFANYNVNRTISAEKPPQNMAPSFGSNPWRPDGIWGNSKNVIGGTFSSQRDLPGSRGSDDASPTAVSGSAQLNHQSEAETPTWPRNGIWGNQDSSNQGRPDSGTASPSQTRDNLAQQNLQDSHLYSARSAVGQNGTTFAGRAKINGGYAPVFGGMNDNTDNSASYNALGSKFSFDGTAAFKRGSQGEFPNLSQTRENSISGPRASDYSSQTTPGALNHDLPQYPFEGSSRGSISRPSGPHQSVSFPTNGTANRILPSAQAGLEQGLSELLSGSLNINDSRAADVVNGFANQSNRPFQFNPSSQAWSGDPGANGRGYGQIYPQQDVYGDQIPASYMDVKRGSIERASPSSVNFPRNGLNSPRYTPGTGSRHDSWSQSRPISRGLSASQDFERQTASSFSQPPNSYYSAGSYYGNNYSTQYPPPVQPYDIYGQSAGLRNQMAVAQAQFGMVNQYIPPVSIPVRPSRDQDPGKGVRSVLLEDFRASNRSNKRFELKDIYGHVVEFSGDQHGSRFIQEKLQNANSDEKDQIFQEIKSNAIQLMKDVFGNYVIQKFFEHGSQVQKTILAREMKGKVAELSTQMYACRVVQKALEHVLVDQQEEIVEELKPDIMRIVKDQNGNHVVQKIITLVPQMCVSFMMAASRGQISTLAAHSYGCRVIQRMLESGTAEERRELMEEVRACALQLITDQYGNYVAQHIIQKGSDEDRTWFISLIAGQLIEFSLHKFASNVVEKCVEFGTDEERRMIMSKLITADQGRHPLDRVMLDQYGNYVIQNVVKHLKGQEKADLLSEMRQRFTVLKKTVQSRQLGAIERLLEKHEQDSSAEAKASSTQTSGRNAPAALQLDVSSTVNTPALTMEHSSPKSDGSPSDKPGDEAIAHAGKAIVEPSLSTQPEVVDVDGDEN